MSEDFRSYESIKKSMRDLGSIDSAAEITALDEQSGYAHTVDIADERQGMTLDEAFSVLELRANPILQAHLSEAHNIATRAENNSKDQHRQDRLSQLDTAQGARAVIAVFENSFVAAAEVVKSASPEERLNFTAQQAAIFESVADGRRATVEVRQPAVAAPAFNKMVDAETLRKNTDAAVDYFSKERR